MKTEATTQTAETITNIIKGLDRAELDTELGRKFIESYLPSSADQRYALEQVAIAATHLRYALSALRTMANR